METQILQSNLIPVAPKLFNSPELDRELILRFFMYFARAEYALKRAGYLMKDKDGKPQAWADWNGFATSVNRKFNPDSSEELSSAVKYLLKNPPKKQVVINGRLDWSEINSRDANDLKYLLELLRVVRNNLFHGGKFPLPVAEVSEISRNEKLLESGLLVLGAAIKLSLSVNQFFSEEIY